jgi:hypothetical protein
VVELDLATASMRSLPPLVGTQGAPFAPLAGADWLMLQFDSSPVIAFLDGATQPTELRDWDMWSSYWQVDTDRFWRTEYDPSNGRVEAVVAIDVRGEPTGRRVDPAGLWASGAAPRGRVLVGDVSTGIYSVSPEGSSRLPDGRVLAISADHVLLYSCGATLDDCGVRVVDRNTGASRPVPLEEEIDPVQLSGWWGPPLPRPSITPDGAAALVIIIDESGRPIVAALELDSGARTEFGWESNVSFNRLPSATWSVDGRFAFVVDDGTVVAYDRVTREQFPVSSELPPISALTVRPTRAP